MAAAQTPKQISYPVQLQIEQAASSSAIRVINTPPPIIRPSEQTFSTPPKPLKKSSNTHVKPVVTKNTKTLPAKTSGVVKKTASSTLKKPAVKSSPTKAPRAITAKTKPPVKKPIITTTSATNSVVEPKSIPIKETPVNEQAVNNEVTKVELREVGVSENVAPRILAADAATHAAVQRIIDDEPAYVDQPDSVDMEQQNETVMPAPAAVESEPVRVGKTSDPVTAPAKNIAPLPMSNRKEDFVIDFEHYVETKIAPKLPGVALAVIANGKVTVLKTYGVKKVGGKDAINTDTLFRLASVSKTIGSAAGALLVEDGLVRWDTRVTAVLPALEFSSPKYGDQLTISNILSQSTGLPTHTNDNFIEAGLPFAEVARRLRYVNFVCPPGKCYGYQNVTYSLISNIILKKTGKTYEEYVQEKLFDPLAMRTASFGLAALKASNNYALPHIASRKGWYPQTITENYYRINPAAGANASITDMSRWILAHMGHNPEVLSPTSLNSLHDKVTRNTPAQNHYGTREGVTASHYGLGWRVFDYRGDKNFIHHGGYVLGFRSEMVINPELQIGMIILSNSNRLAGDIIFKFLDAYEDNKRGSKKIAALDKK